MQDKISAVNKRLDDLRSQGTKTKKRIVVRVDAATGGTMNFDCSYLANQASWLPLYDVRVDATANKMELVYYGVVTQSTGENWDGVQLMLSTAHPARGNYIPELAALYLQQQEPSTMRGMAKADSRVGDAMPAPGPGEGNDFSGNPLVARPRTSTIDEHELSADFIIADPVSIPSDGQAHQTTIADTTLDAMLEYVAVPKLSGSAYLRAKAVNTTGAPMLAGKANSFLDGQFVSTATLPAIVAGDTIALPLGTNDAVKVTRKLVDKFQEYNGVLTKTYKWDYEYLTTISNKSAADVTITVTDQIPISQNEKITVETKSLTRVNAERRRNIHLGATSSPRRTKTNSFEIFRRISKRHENYPYGIINVLSDWLQPAR